MAVKREGSSAPTGVPSLVETSRARLEALGETHTPLGALLMLLAAELDAGAGMAAAAIGREYRATLKELTPDDGGDSFADLVGQLSA